MKTHLFPVVGICLIFIVQVGLLLILGANRNSEPQDIKRTAPNCDEPEA